MFQWSRTIQIDDIFKECFITFYNSHHSSIQIFLTSPSHLTCILASKFMFLLECACNRRVGEKLLLKHSPIWSLPDSHLEIKIDEQRIICANAAVIQFER